MSIGTGEVGIVLNGEDSLSRGRRLTGQRYTPVPANLHTTQLI